MNLLRIYISNFIFNHPHRTPQMVLCIVFNYQNYNLLYTLITRVETGLVSRLEQDISMCLRLEQLMTWSPLYQQMQAGVAGIFSTPHSCSLSYKLVTLYQQMQAGGPALSTTMHWSDTGLPSWMYKSSDPIIWAQDSGN